MDNFRLALVRQKYRPDGGAERFVARALTALSGQNIELNVITRQWNDAVNPNWHIHICNPQNGAGSAANVDLPMLRGRCGHSKALIWCKAMSAFPVVAYTEQVMASIVAT